jgi:hypothetical protein
MSAMALLLIVWAFALAAAMATAVIAACVLPPEDLEDPDS